MVDYTQIVGNTVELKCMIDFMLRGFHCCIPYGNCAKYDFIAERDGKMYRIQCKSSNKVLNKSGEETGAFAFSTCTHTTNTKKTVTHKYTRDDIDYFATVFDDVVYVVCVDECDCITKTLRYTPPKNNNANYSDASKYTITAVFGDAIGTEEKQKQYGADYIEKTYTPIYCSCCGINEVTRKGNMCVDCARASRRKTDRPSKEELQELVDTTPLIKIGAMFGVSDNAVRKWCAGYGIEYRKHINGK